MKPGGWLPQEGSSTGLACSAVHICLGRLGPSDLCKEQEDREKKCSQPTSKYPYQVETDPNGI